MNTNSQIHHDPLTRERLIQLLDYVAQQSQDINLDRYQIHAPSISLQDLQQAEGVSLKSADQSIWFEVKRLKAPVPPVIPVAIKAYIRFMDAGQPVLDMTALAKQTLLFKKLQKPYLYKNSLNAHQFKQKLAELNHIQRQVQQCVASWQQWFTDNQKIKKSIAIYDLLFSWKTNLSMTVSSTPAEIVAGLGMMVWQLPSTGQRYVYPLITQQIEIEILPNGVIQVMAQGARPNLEMTAFLAQQALPQAAELKNHLKTQLYDGRELHILDESSYQDIVQAAVTALDAHGSLLADHSLPVAQPQLKASLAWSIFSRPRISSVLAEDIENLKAELERGAEIFEQPRTLVQKASDIARDQQYYQFRGRSGLNQADGSSSDTPQELYFPLPYNQEQVTIVQQLMNQAGVVVQGPPGTGKTHTIANIICHYLAHGKRVLVTAQQGHVLKTVQEKIPANLRPLVVSRVGSSNDSRRQLEASIDMIVQQLSQLNSSTVKATIQRALQLIDNTHRQMADIDQQINRYATVHYQNITVDGKDLRPMEIADLVVQHADDFAWLTDRLDLSDRYQLPFDTNQLQHLRQARQRVARHLPERLLQRPATQQLPTLATIATLHHSCQRLLDIEKLVQSGQQWQARQNTDESSFLHFKERLQQALALHEQLSEALQHCNWLGVFRKNLSDPHLQLEVNALKQLYHDMQRFIELRAALLANPVDIPAAFFAQPKAAEALQRAVETGKPFAWFHFANKELENLFAGLRVAGQPPTLPEHWQHIKRFIDYVAEANAFAVRWNTIAAGLGLPAMQLQDYQLHDFLRELDRTWRTLGVCMALAENFDNTLYPQYQQLFLHKVPGNFFMQADSLQQTIEQIEAHQDFSRLSLTRQTLQVVQHYLSGFQHPLASQLQQFFQQLGDDASIEDKLAAYQPILATLQTLEQHQADFDLINRAVEAFTSAGAYQLGKALGATPHTGNADDPVLPENLPQAWQWARLQQHLQDMNQRQELLALQQKRQRLEQVLSQTYAQLAAEQAWLNLKTSASDHVLTALQRYKTAVQKIGKGTGKNASRYRKDAQDAMLQAADAIPCWVMTHYQVSETMPARMGVFDLIIVDEASQSTIEALPVLMRGKKLLVVGDDKQVSPSNVGLSSERITLLRNKYLLNQPNAAVLTPDMSLYDIASSIYPSTVMLLEHFRCHPAIIAYSNQQFYNQKIRPMRLSRQSERLSPALISIYTPEGRRGENSQHKINQTEAAAIIHEMAHLMANPAYQGRSMGVISLLGNEQAEYIQTRAMDTFGAELLTRVNFASGDASAFQGAERDIIFLSMVADPTNCHPLSRRDHEQRLNVAASRARERMYLVHSVTTSDLSAKDLRVALLGQYQAGTAGPATPSQQQKLAQCSSAFERELLLELLQRGYQVTPQLVIGPYVIDLVVEGEQDVRLAIACDADNLHGPEQWSLDMQQQRTLERAGWYFWRCFAVNWRMQKASVLADLLALLQGLHIHPVQANATPEADIENRSWVDSNAALPDFNLPAEAGITQATTITPVDRATPASNPATEAVAVTVPASAESTSASGTGTDNNTLPENILPPALAAEISIELPPSLPSPVMEPADINQHTLLKQCAKCNIRQASSQFLANNYYSDGLSSWCEGCLYSTKKWCVQCNRKKTAIEFVQNRKRQDGLAKFCKDCTQLLLNS